VGDFGFAKRVHTPESLMSRVGTPTYVAPEYVSSCGSRIQLTITVRPDRILKNLPHDERVDLWSVGIVIFVLLVGYPPFLDEDQSNLFRKIRTGEWTFIDEDWKQVSDDAKDLIRGLLAVDPQERWTIDECLGSKWIGLDPTTLSENDLSDSLRSLRGQKKCLRSSGIGFTGLLDSLRSVSVATQAQESVHQPMEVDE
jgi:calcium/calmodulin-dependent protein kinase I